jgi:putative ABC transport system substrate-binding protein
MRRRDFITLLGGAAAWSLDTRAQERLPVVGVLRINPRDFETFAEPFRRDMKDLGWEEGRNVRFEFVWAGGRNEDVPALARELVAKQVDLIVTFGNPGVSAVQSVSATIPLIGMTDDMVREGLAASSGIRRDLTVGKGEQHVMQSRSIWRIKKSGAVIRAFGAVKPADLARLR